LEAQLEAEALGAEPPPKPTLPGATISFVCWAVAEATRSASVALSMAVTRRRTMRIVANTALRDVSHARRSHRERQYSTARDNTPPRVRHRGAPRAHQPCWPATRATSPDQTRQTTQARTHWSPVQKCATPSPAVSQLFMHTGQTRSLLSPLPVQKAKHLAANPPRHLASGY
jgi:hypothetical protein